VPAAGRNLPPRDNSRPALSVQQAADRLGCSRQNVYARLASGTLDGCQEPGRSRPALRVYEDTLPAPIVSALDGLELRKAFDRLSRTHERLVADLTRERDRERARADAATTAALQLKIALSERAKADAHDRKMRQALAAALGHEAAARERLDARDDAIQEALTVLLTPNVAP
jgi:hypothetical protein